MGYGPHWDRGSGLEENILKLGILAIIIDLKSKTSEAMCDDAAIREFVI